jgi:hypothetical protein
LSSTVTNEAGSFFSFERLFTKLKGDFAFNASSSFKQSEPETELLLATGDLMSFSGESGVLESDSEDVPESRASITSSSILPFGFSNI